MSDSKKRSRKSKLEVRDDDIEETENAVLHLQSYDFDEEELLITFPDLGKPGSYHETPSQQIPSPPPNLDHTYALPNSVQAPPPVTTSAFATTSSLSSSSCPTTTLSIPSSSALQLSVKVEVEEIDESIFNEILSPRILGKSKQKTRYYTEKNKPKPVTILQVDLDRMYKVADEIGSDSTNLADKFLSIELKNIWGRALKPKKEDDPYEELIQKALRKWTDYGLYKNGWGPLFYQCHICKLAWWYLAPFREHIRTNHDKNVKIQYEENGHESYVYAYEKTTKYFIYINCEGNCYRCEQPFSYHVKQLGTLYRCKKCKQSFGICVSMRQHELTCESKEQELNYKCTVCSAKFNTNDELDSHNITVHVVRSDIVTPFICKTCSMCKRKYHHYPTHMCVRSTMMSPCSFCYRRFQTKMLQAMHHIMQYGCYKCPICKEILPSRCMETEHLLAHTDNYVMAYKCINYDCPPTILFPNLDLMKLHKKRYHKQKIDKRKTFYDKVLIPMHCVKTAQTPTLEAIARAYNSEVFIAKKPATTEPEVEVEPEVEDWCVPNVNKQTNMQTDELAEQDDVIIVKQEPQEPIDIDAYHNGPGQMDYAEMLSKVFKVSDAVRTPRKLSVDEIATQIKIEPADEKEVSVQDLQISFKQEPTDVDLDIPVDAQIDSCLYKNDGLQNHSRKRSYQESSLCTSQNVDRQDDSKFNTCQTDGRVKIKKEPQDDEIDVISYKDVPVNLEEIDIKQEVIEQTEINKNTENDLYANIKTKKKNKKKNVKKKSKSSRGKNNTEIESNTNSLLKKNIIVTKEHLHVKVTTIQIAESVTGDKMENANDSDTKTKIVKQNSDTKTKIRTLNLDENGRKIRKLYKCAKCGYEQCHKLFRLHQRSFCIYSPARGKAKLVKKFKCTKCNTRAVSINDYLLHFTKHGYERLICPSCNIKFDSLIELVPHFHQHVKHNYVNCWMIKDVAHFSKRQHKCQTCHDIVRPEDFFKHWESHLILRAEATAPVKTEIDDVTGEDVASHKSLQPTLLHTAIQQLRSLVRETQCRVCLRQFSRRLDVKRHLIEHLLMDAHNTKDKTRSAKFRCQICFDGFPRPENYKYHMRDHARLPVYRCEICDKTFSDSSNFAKHKKIHNMWAMVCDICKKKFQAKSSLEKHMIMHLTTDPIPCKLCSRKFYSISQYNKHYKSSHVRNFVFRCVVCDLSFGSSREKWDHAWEVHNERKQKADCPKCHRQFRKYQDMKNHARDEHDIKLKKIYDVRKCDKIPKSETKIPKSKIKKPKSETKKPKSETKLDPSYRP